MINLMVCGHKQHGKDTFCEFAEELGVSFQSSSREALGKVIWPLWGKERYFTKEDCFRDRHNHRVKWYNLITAYNSPDLTRLARDIYRKSQIYCGLRNIDEFKACKFHGLFDLSIWVDASERKEPEGAGSCTVTAADCDITITNNGSPADFEAKSKTLIDILQRT